ncbi:MAG: hypothetical protein WCC17_07610, partial [Candidatus Nitrosopolaris sp.]
MRKISGGLFICKKTGYYNLPSKYSSINRYETIVHIGSTVNPRSIIMDGEHIVGYLAREVKS